MQSLHHLLTYAVHDINHMLRYPLSIYLSSISIRSKIVIVRPAILTGSTILTVFS